MTNTKTLALLALLALAGLTAWRIATNRYSGTRLKTIWRAALLGLLIALMADFAPGLGAAFGLAVVLFTLARAVPAGTVTGKGGILGSSSSSHTPTSVLPTLPGGASPVPSSPGPSSPGAVNPALIA